MKSLFTFLCTILFAVSVWGQCVPIPDCVCCATATPPSGVCEDYVITAYTDDWLQAIGLWPPETLAQCAANEWWQAGPGVITEYSGGLSYLHPQNDFGTLKTSPEVDDATFHQVETFLAFHTDVLNGKTVTAAKLRFWLYFAFPCNYAWYAVADYSNWYIDGNIGTDYITPCTASDFIVGDLARSAWGPKPEADFRELGRIYQAHATHGGTYVDIPFDRVDGINTTGDTGLVVSGGGAHDILHLPTTWFCEAGIASSRNTEYNGPQLIVTACE